MDPRREKSLAIAAAAPFVLWGGWCLARGEHRWEVIALMVLTPSLALGGDRARRLLWGTFPMLLVAILYDAMRFVKHLGITPARVHVCDLRAVEARIFGDGTHTVHDWIQGRNVLALDLLGAIPYGTFLFTIIGAAFWLAYAHRPALLRIAWAFFFVNLASFLVHHLYPSAPPWYFHAHGCAVDVSVGPNEGPNLARVDLALGYPYFHGLYSRSQDVFGAVPSLHVGYPLLILRAGWQHFSIAVRSVAIGYAALMAFAAVWLDHHWILDLALGVVFALAADALAVSLVRAVATDAARVSAAPVRLATVSSTSRA